MYPSVNTSSRCFSKFCFIYFTVCIYWSVWFRQVQSSSEIPPFSTVFLRRKWLICHMSKASTQMLESVHRFEKIHAYLQLYISTVESILLHADFCLFNLWVPNQISVWSCCHFFLHCLIFRGRLSDSWQMEIVMEHLEATCCLDRSWKSACLRICVTAKKNMRYETMCFISQFQILDFFSFSSTFKSLPSPIHCDRITVSGFLWYN